MNVALKINEFSVGGYNHYIGMVRNHCPRGIDYFCDGTPNPIPEGKYKSIGKCEHYKSGICRYFDTREKKGNNSNY